jgi:hypothetical protein
MRKISGFDVGRPLKLINLLGRMMGRKFVRQLVDAVVTAPTCWIRAPTATYTVEDH